MVLRCRPQPGEISLNKDAGSFSGTTAGISGSFRTCERTILLDLKLAAQQPIYYTFIHIELAMQKARKDVLDLGHQEKQGDSFVFSLIHRASFESGYDH
ncbi:hypothetical protein FRX31_005758 [Thalictrum thalictroides]|uniref:Uncharacterized protein n=1 Tax=Thalictrum thalictroides TaxID=46969 RepID=A0A7J6X6H0_THATH|nr:hypothetical protein FRX31_005758 [Thalictrum thalictroides]